MYNLWENMYSETALCFGFLALYSEHVRYAQLLSTCFSGHIGFVHRCQYCTMRTVCCVHDYSIQLQLVLVIGSYTLHKPLT